VSSKVQQELAGRVEEAIGSRRRGVSRDPEYRALRELASRNRKSPPATPHDALQHIVDVAHALTHATYGALAVTGADDYVEGFIVSGMPADALSKLKGPPQGHGPLGTMRQDGLPVHLKDVSTDGKAFGFPPKHPPMRELLGVAIFAGGEVRGALYVTDRTGGKQFGDADRQMLDVLAHHAGLVIARSWY